MRRPSSSSHPRARASSCSLDPAARYARPCTLTLTLALSLTLTSAGAHAPRHAAPTPIPNLTLAPSPTLTPTPRFHQVLMHQDVLHRVSTPSMLARRPRYSLGMEPRLTPCTFHALTMHLLCTAYVLPTYCLLTAYLLLISMEAPLRASPPRTTRRCGRDYMQARTAIVSIGCSHSK